MIMQNQQQLKAPDMTANEANKWRTATDSKTGKTYYYHIETKESRWDLPFVISQASSGPTADLAITNDSSFNVDISNISRPTESAALESTPSVQQSIIIDSKQISSLENESATPTLQSEDGSWNKVFDPNSQRFY